MDASNGMISKYLIEKDVEGNGSGLIFGALSHHWSGETEGNRRKPKTEWSLLGPKFKFGSS
jgi:hypothetical protein